VRAKVIARLARGVFVYEDEFQRTVKTVYEVARLKAESFGKTMVEHGSTQAFEMGLRCAENESVIFLINGASSSFQYGNTKIVMKGGCMRKIAPGNVLAARVMRALWHIGRRECHAELVLRAMRPCGRTDREQMRRCFGWMPAWLSGYFSKRKYLPGTVRMIASATGA
jgi:hypothetical protein